MSPGPKITPGTPLFRPIRPRGSIGEVRVTADGVNRAIKSALARYYELTGMKRANVNKAPIATIHQYGAPRA